MDVTNRNDTPKEHTLNTDPPDTPTAAPHTIAGSGVCTPPPETETES